MKYEEIDNQLIALIKEGKSTFDELVTATELPFRTVDQRLQYLRRKNHIRYEGRMYGWRVNEEEVFQ